MKNIILKGARENNLKNINVTIPRNKVVCLVGVSGSGKSTIAFDIIAREGQRQYFESLPSFARRYLQKSNRPNVDVIKGVSATIVISQDRVRGNPRSTVGTLTEAYTYLRLLYSRIGLPSMDSSYYSFNHPYGACKICKGLGKAVEVNVDKILDRDKSLNKGALKSSEWYVGGRQWSIIKASHYFDMDKKIKDYTDEELDRLLNAPPELLESKDEFIVNRWTFQGVIYRIQHRNTKVHRGPSKNDLKYFDFIDCPECNGGRLNKKSLEVKLNGFNIGEIANMPLDECLKFVKNIKHVNALAIKPRLEDQLESLIKVGVDYLSLNRSSDTLSDGEAQRVKMARQIGCDLIESIYVLDEPTAGLHPKDVKNIVENLARLRDSGNTVLVVEHDETMIRNADYLVEVGPGGGKNGGEIVTSGKIKDLVGNPRSLTAKYLSGLKKIKLKRKYRQANGFMKVIKANKHNLKNLNLQLPTGVMIALTGVSGSGKSSLVEEIVSQHEDKIVLVDQSSVGANKRGCLATYVGIFDVIRKIFARENKMHPSLFSYNSHGGCELCKGVGYVNMDMNFLGDVKIKCEACKGSRYKEKVLRYKYSGKNIVEVLDMTAVEVGEFFGDQKIKQATNLLQEVGLDYMEMGQTLDTLSGGESQRLKLVSRLQKSNEFYILDEPTSGLHFDDVKKLLKLLNRLVNNGNTVLVIEHNMDVIKNADWVIDLGPEGGEKGGYLVVQGTPRMVAECSASYTGRYLKKTLNT
ncbi:MAG: excinuclease ABC subunit UvrA [Candidatus Beckwithbacteria bacterium]|nr:excinuclease ABC subunit UvrA [Patescibacteria group bacterium]